MKYPIFLFLLILPAILTSQTIDEKIETVQSRLADLQKQAEALNQELEGYKLERVQEDLVGIGFPSANYILHSAMALEYSEDHEQARWVAHIITPDIINGTVSRTNDFREDPMVKTGTAVEKDYFLKFLQPDSTYKYDGFGYDRGHLAPSADFRWSEKALSESYFYSNMSPQVADFNRESWADLEATIRGYIFSNPTVQLYVVTGPILEEDLPVIERGVNKVSIPRSFFKVVLDLQNQRGIGFLMPNESVAYPLETFATSIDEIERITGLDFFENVSDDLERLIEAKVDKKAWLPESAGGDVEPIYAPSLPPGHFNTIQAKRFLGNGKEIKVCGTAVGTRYSRSGNFWINLDKQYPNQIFSVFIRKKDLVNFSTKPEILLANQKVCFSGPVSEFNGTPTMNIETEEAIILPVPAK